MSETSLNTQTSMSTSPNRLPLAISVSCLLVFMLAFTTNSMDRLIFPVLLTFISKTYGFALKDAGLLSTVFTLGIGLAAVATEYMFDKWSRKTVMVAGMVIYSVFTLATIMAHGFADMLIYRALTGVGEAMQMAALYSAAGSYFYKDKGLAIGTVNMGFGLGGFLGPSVGMKLTLATNDWHTPFIVFTILGLVIASIIWFLVPRLFTESVPETAGEKQEADVSNMPEAFWNRNLIACAIAAVAWGGTIYGFIGLYPTFLIKHLNFPPMTASYTMSIYGLGCALSIVGGWIGDRLSQRWAVVASWIGSIVCGYLIFNVVTGVWQQNVLAFLMGIFSSSLYVPNLISTFQRSVRPHLVGKASSVYLAGGYLGGAFSGYLLGWLVGLYGWGGAGLIQLSILPMIGVIALLCMKNRELFQVR